MTPSFPSDWNCAACSLTLGPTGSITVTVDSPAIWAPYATAGVSSGLKITANNPNLPFVISAFTFSSGALKFTAPNYGPRPKRDEVVVPAITVNLFLWAPASVNQIKLSTNSDNVLVGFSFDGHGWGEIKKTGSTFAWDGNPVG